MSTFLIPPGRAMRAAALGAGFGLLGGVLVGACADSADAPPFVAAADSRQLMLSVLEPAAEVYWDAVGFIWDMEGTYEIEPRTAEEWEAVTAGVSGSEIAARTTESMGASPEPPATQTISRSGGVRR